MQNYAGGNFNHSILQTFEVLCWSIATICSLAATALSVLLIIAMAETNCAEDSNYFLRLLSEYTFGIGPISAVFFLIISIVFAVIALVPFFLIQFGLTFTIIAMILLVIIVAGCGFFAVQTVATFKVAKETDTMIEDAYTTVDMNIAQLREDFKYFVAYLTKEEYSLRPLLSYQWCMMRMRLFHTCKPLPVLLL